MSLVREDREAFTQTVGPDACLYNSPNKKVKNPLNRDMADTELMRVVFETKKNNSWHNERRGTYE